MPYSLLLKYGLPFLAGVAVTLLWHQTVTQAIQIDQQAETITRVETKIVYVERETNANNENTTDYLDELDKARKQADDLRADLAAGRIAVRLCKADQVRADVSAANSAAVADQARADRAELEASVAGIIEHAARNDAWMQSAHEFMSRQRNAQ